MLTCSLFMSCEKDVDDPKVKETTAQKANDDDPNNGYGDIIDPEN